MMKEQKIALSIALTTTLLVLAGAGLWWSVAHSAATVGKSEMSESTSNSVLVTVQGTKRQPIPITMHVFGEVATGKIETLSFPQAGQIVQIGVLPGQKLHRGEFIAGLTSDPNAQSAYNQAANALAFAQREFERVHDLLILQLATQSQEDTAARQLQDTKAAMIAQNRLGSAKELARLVSPFNAVVTAVPVMQGDRVQPGAAIVQLGRLDTLRVQLALEPSQSRLVHAGMQVAINAVQDKTRSVIAKITEVQDLIDPKTQMVGALVVLSLNQQSHLLPGMRVEASIQLGDRQAWAVPRQAVLTDDKGPYLFQIANGKAKRIELEKLIEDGQQYGVQGKLDAALPVVVLGNYELENGVAVRETAR